MNLYPLPRRFAPTFAEHMARYAYALRFCYRKSVLDAASSYGFGAHLLSYVANDVTLADVNQKYLDLAKRLYKFLCPVDYKLCDFEKDFPEGEWDTIISFETIEHLDEKGGEFFVENVAKHLKPGGQFVFSVPHLVANHEHKVLYDTDKIFRLVGKYLKIIDINLQTTRAIDNIPMYKGLQCHVGIAQKI